MTIQEKAIHQENAQAIFEAVDNEYSIPTYFEDRVKKAIERALIQIKKKEGNEA